MKKIAVIFSTFMLLAIFSPTDSFSQVVYKSRRTCNRTVVRPQQRWIAGHYTRRNGRMIWTRGYHVNVRSNRYWRPVRYVGQNGCWTRKVGRWIYI